MASRALIIAIEDYPLVQGAGVAKNLPGTLRGGLDFRDWLLKKWTDEGIAPGNRQLLFCSEPLQPGQKGATNLDIRHALLSLRQVGQGATEELFVFFSGHGFSFVKDDERADVIISSDFLNEDLSPHCCFKLEEMIDWLRVHLGPGRHYYFVDACRNVLTSQTITVGPLPPRNPQSSGEPSTFVLQSTVPGAVAAVGGPFAAALRSGLSGAGKAKTWDSRVSDAMVIRYDSLRSYVKAVCTRPRQIYSRTTGTEGDNEVILATLRPVPQSECRIEISNPRTPLKGSILYWQGRAKAVQEEPLRNPPYSLALDPDDYAISLRVQDAGVVPRDPVKVELYENKTVVFKIVDEELVAASPEPLSLKSVMLARGDIVVPGVTTMRLKNLSTGIELVIRQSQHVEIEPGRYVATLESGRGGVFLRKEIELKPGQFGSLNLTDWGSSAPHLAIAGKLPTVNGGVEFSESLEETIADPDLDLWLALLGGGRILGSTGDYSKIAPFPLHSFLNEDSDASPIYVLAGFENPNVNLKVGVSAVNDSGARLAAPAPTWAMTSQPRQMPGIREAYFATPPGSQLVSFRLAEQAPYTIASFAMPNRAMPPIRFDRTIPTNARWMVSQTAAPLKPPWMKTPGASSPSISTCVTLV
jgi:hypothetical protein